MRVLATGGRAGKTFVWRDFSFVNGVCSIAANDEGTLLNLRRNLQVITEFEYFEQRERERAVSDGTSNIPKGPGAGEPVGNGGLLPELERTSETPISGDGQGHANPEASNTGLGSNGNGPPDGVNPKADNGTVTLERSMDNILDDDDEGEEAKAAKLIRKAIQALDVNNDEFFTGAGVVKVEALANKFPSITRADITAAAPDLTRGELKRLKAEQPKG